MRMASLVALLILAASAVSGCADSDSGEGAPPPPGFNRAHSSIDDYGRANGYINPNACWRSTSPAQCF